MCSEVSKKKRGAMTDKYDKATNEIEAGGPSQPSHREASPLAYPTPMEVPSSKSTGLRGRKLVFPSPLLQTRLSLGGILLEQKLSKMFL
jgi:hypothetical protein